MSNVALGSLAVSMGFAAAIVGVAVVAYALAQGRAALVAEARWLVWAMTIAAVAAWRFTV